MIRSVFYLFPALSLDPGLKLGVLGLLVDEPVEPHHVEHHGDGGDQEEIDELPHLHSEGPLGVLLLELIAEGN